jgi:hypothetical protein
MTAEKADYDAYIRRMIDEGRLPVPPKDWR